MPQSDSKTQLLQILAKELPELIINSSNYEQWKSIKFLWGRTKKTGWETYFKHRTTGELVKVFSNSKITDTVNYYLTSSSHFIVNRGIDAIEII